MKSLLVFYSFLISVGIAVTGWGIWAVLHLKHLPAYPIWIGVVISIIVTLNTIRVAVKIIGEINGKEDLEKL